MYFIVIDSNDNIFGHYHSGVIERASSQAVDDNIFLFTLNSNGRCDIQKYNSKGNSIYTFIYNDNDFYRCGNSSRWCYIVGRINSKMSYIDGKGVTYTFDGIQKIDLTGNYWPDKVESKRIVVIQMK